MVFFFTDSRGQRIDAKWAETKTVSLRFVHIFTCMAVKEIYSIVQKSRKRKLPNFFNCSFEISLNFRVKVRGKIFTCTSRHFAGTKSNVFSNFR